MQKLQNEKKIETKSVGDIEKRSIHFKLFHFK